jgi:Fis family transcriptional regulator
MAEDKQNKSANVYESAGGGVGPIRACVRDTLDDYFEQLDGTPCAGLYKMVLREVEVPLLQVVMRECGGNQTRAAELLGINRGTLRKKLQHYGLEE